MMKSGIFVIGAFFLALALLMAGCAESGPGPQQPAAPVVQPQNADNPPQQPAAGPAGQPANQAQQPASQPIAPGKARMVFAISDAAVNMSAVSGIKLTIDAVSIRNAAGAWINVSSAPRTYDLLQLNSSGKAAVLADSQLAAGAYDKVGLHISKVVVSDASGNHEAVMPSGDISADADASAVSGSTTAVIFDFSAAESLHAASDGAYVLTPVIRLETLQGTQAQAGEGGTVGFSGGTANTDTQIGMGLDGNTGVGVSLPPSIRIIIGADGKLSIGPMR